MSSSNSHYQVFAEQLTMRSVSWSAYNELAASTDRAGRLLTFDRGVLEIVSPSRAHELYKTMLGRMIEMYCLHHEIDMASAASTTFKRDDLQRGFEADESYYISHEAQVRDKLEIDLAIDPAPDLVIEVEQSQSAIDKLELLAAMGVPEFWRYNGKTLWLGRLTAGQYTTLAGSIELTGFPVASAVATLQSLGTASETTLMRRFMKSLIT